MMSRVHKYRAYDKINKRMWYSNEIGESENDLGFFNHFNEEGELDFILLGKDPYGEFNGYLKEFLPKMEFTGLLDKNKVEIYEKDLIEATRLIFKGTGLETTDHILEEKILFEVDYIQGAFLLSNPKKCILLNALFCDKYQRDVLSSSAHYKISDDVYEKYVDFKRIGNIFENPEYLEE